MTKVSVIVPVYNTEKYLPKCLDSLTAQTLSGIEIICINDCSPDNCLSILQKYAAKDNRIKIIDFKENKGAAVARNTGIENTKGEYIGFVDSDDFVDFDFYEKLYNKAIDTKADIVKGAYKYPDNYIPDARFNEKIIEDKNNFSYGYCSAIFNNQLVKDNHIYFPELRDMEDPVFAYKAALKANNIMIVKDAFVNITLRNDSQTAGIPSLNRIKDKFIGLSNIIEAANNSAVSEKSYVYTLVLWLNMIVEHSLLNKDIKVRQFIADTTMILFDKMHYKDKFIAQLSLENEFLAQAIQRNKRDHIINYEQSLTLYNIRKKLKYGK